MIRQNEKSNFIVELGSATSGHLIFTSDAAGIRILTDPSIPDLARGHFEHNLSRLRVDDGAITIQDRPFSASGGPVNWHGPLGEIILNSSIPWEIEFRSGISDLNANLYGLELQSLDLLGGASQVRLLMPKPVKTSFLYITGGIRNSRIRVPRGVGIRVQISGRVSQMVFDNQRFDAIEGETNLMNSEFKNSTSRCDIFIAGDASNVVIEEYA